MSTATATPIGTCWVRSRTWLWPGSGSGLGWWSRLLTGWGWTAGTWTLWLGLFILTITSTCNKEQQNKKLLLLRMDTVFSSHNSFHLWMHTHTESTAAKQTSLTLAKNSAWPLYMCHLMQSCRSSYNDERKYLKKINNSVLKTLSRSKNISHDMKLLSPTSWRSYVKD